MVIGYVRTRIYLFYSLNTQFNSLWS